MPPDADRRWPPPRRIAILGARLSVDPMQVQAIATIAAAVLGSAIGLWWFARVGLGWFEVAIAVLLWYAVDLAITLGFHRHFTHLAFDAKPALRTALGVLGCMALQGPIKVWASIHRRHHRYSDLAGDPHSPRPGRLRPLAAFLHGHAGWVVSGAYSTYLDYIRDLMRDRVVTRVDRHYWLWGALGWIAPGILAALWYASWQGFVSGLLAGGPLRCLVHFNLVWSVNSIGHVFGRRRFATREDSRNSALVCVLSPNGEGLHNNHHGFPWSARFALFKGEVDPGWWWLRLFERLGWASRLRTPSLAMVARRAAPGSSPGGARAPAESG